MNKVNKNSTDNEKVQLSYNHIYGFIDGLSSILFLCVGYLPSQNIRKFIYKFIYQMNIEKNVVIYRRLEARRPHKITIGQGTIIGDHCILDGRNYISIGCHVNFSSGVWIWTEQHMINDENFGSSGGPVSIGDRVWLSSRTTILPNIRIGEGAVVAAGAVVTKDVDPYTIVAGIPAKKIGIRKNSIDYSFTGRYIPFI
jgi:acetyltransferase-like isoleucine patch superfamily enzyme